MMDIATLKNTGLIIYECIVGSHAYGIATPRSDTDITGVFVTPKEEFYRGSFSDQVNNETNDISYFEIGKFLSLLAKSNPTALELLYSPDDCILTKTALMALVDPSRFLSKKCEDSFARYAIDQIKKARGLNKKIANPMERQKKTILDFCHVLHGQGSMPVKRHLAFTGMEEDRCGLVAVAHMGNVYALFYDASPDRSLRFNGLLRDDTSMDLLLSSVPKDLQPSGHIHFNKDGFSKYCREYREYQDWVEKRNEARFETTISHGRNYDSKNMMHTFRLLEMAEEIALYKTITVRRPDASELLKIRAGEYAYEELIEKADIRLKRINEAYRITDLQPTPDIGYAEKTLVAVRREFYDKQQILANG